MSKDMNKNKRPVNQRHIKNTKQVIDVLFKKFMENNIIEKSIIEYIYLIQLKEYIKLNENVYKIGKTKLCNFKRFTYYPSGSVVYHHTYCKNSDICEKLLIKFFKSKYKQRTVEK